MQYAKLLLKAAMLCAGGGLGFGFLVIHEEQNSKRRFLEAQVAEAVISNVSISDAEGGSRICSVSVNFVTNDGQSRSASIPWTEEMTERLGSPESFKKLRVYYDPQDPRLVKVEGGRWKCHSAQYLAASIVLAAASLLFLHIGLSRRDRVSTTLWPDG